MATSKVAWYVVQVQTGRERAMCELIERVAPKGLLGGVLHSQVPDAEEVPGRVARG